MTTLDYYFSKWLFSLGCFFLTSISIGFGANAKEDAPPRILRQSNREVWFHVPSGGGASGKPLRLICDASGHPDVRYEWLKNGEPFDISSRETVDWYRLGQSGSIVFSQPDHKSVGTYQCQASNIFGIALSDLFHVKQGVLDHYPHRPVKEVVVTEGSPLTLPCSPPYGNPMPQILWVIRNTKQAFVIETVKKKHITVDGEGNLQFSYVKPFDGRENIIYQCHATSPVLQGETRAGNETRVVVRPSEMVYRKPRLLWASPERLNVTAGKTLRLTCIFSGYPLPQILWHRQGSEIPADRVEYENYGKTIVMSPVKSIDEGSYVCSSGKIEHKMHVSVTAAPHWALRAPSDQVHKEDESATLICDAKGDPLPSITWYKDGEVLEKDDSLRYFFDNNKVLSIKKLNHDVDTGVYQCNASNPFGYVFSNAYLHVLAHAPEFQTPKQQNTKTIIGDTVLLDCDVNAAPDPKISWLDKNNRPLAINDRIQLHTNSTLELISVSLEDSGLYQCNVSNKYGTNLAHRYLEVYEPTVLLKSIASAYDNAEELVLEPYDSAELACEAKSDPRLILEHTWYHDGTEIGQQDGSYRRLGPNRIGLQNVRGRNTGMYTCEAKTEVDKVVSTMKVIVKDIPNTPNILMVQCNTRRAILRWQAPFDNYDPIQKYVIEYKSDFAPIKWKEALTVMDTKRSGPFEAVYDLSPWVNYTFRITAFNSYGASSPGYKVGTVCQTIPSLPYVNPTNVIVQGTEPTNLVIYWKPMHMEQWNGPKFRYRIRYKLDQPESEWQVFDVEDQLANQTTRWEQPIFQPYVVNVIAVNAEGESSEIPRNWRGYSGEAEPTQRSEKASFQVVNSTTVKISWESVPLESVRGHFQGYIIRSWQTSRPIRHRRRSKSSKRLPDVKVSQHETSKLVSIFKPMGEYMVVVIPYNMKYEGPQSEEMKIIMPQGVPLEVENLELKPVGSKAVLTTWDPPKKINGILRGYYIKFIKRILPLEGDVAQADSTVEAAFVQAAENYHLFIDGEPETQYEVRVWAETGGGHGRERVGYVDTWPIGSPEKPSLELKVIDPYSAHVTWIPPEQGMPGIGFYANYSALGSKVWSQSKFVSLPKRELTITDLSPLTDYELFIVAKDDVIVGRNDDGKHTSSGTRVFSTAGTANATFASLYPKPRKDDLTSASWFIGVMSGLALALIALLIVCLCTRAKGGKYPVKKKEAERGHQLNDDEEKSFMEYQYGTTK